MDLRQITYFMRVYEDRSFTRAAERANVVQPALSRQIAALEQEIGAPLFERGPRGVVPTPIGARFYDLVLPLVGGIAQAKQEIVEFARAGQVSGSISCGFPPTFSRAILGAVVAEFLQKYPDVELHISEGYSGVLTEMVRTGELDFALGLIPPDGTGLVTDFEIEEDVALVSGRPIAGPSFTPCRLDKLAGLKLVVPSPKNVLGRQVAAYIAEGAIKPTRLFVTDGYNVGAQLARSSDWGAITPSSGLISSAERRDLFIYPIISPTLRYTLGLVRDHSKPRSAAVDAFLSLTRHHAERIGTTWRQLFLDNGVKRSPKIEVKDRVDPTAPAEIYS